MRLITDSRFFVAKFSENFVAVKAIKNNKNFQISFKKEVYIHYHMQKVGMPVAKLHGYYSNGNEAYVVYEYAERGDLFEKLQSGKNLWQPKRFKYFHKEIFSIGKVLEYMHQNGIAHKDISLENILIHKDQRFLLHDFGDSERFDIDASQFLTDIWGGKENYMSPENYDCCYERRKSFDAMLNDVWCYGVVLMWCFTNDVLWVKPDSEDPDYVEIIENLHQKLAKSFEINSHEHDPIVKANLKELRNLLKLIFVPEFIRPDMKTVLNHPFFQSVSKTWVLDPPPLFS